MNIVILGGSGFVGSRLTGMLLQANHQVTIGDIVPSEHYPELWKNCDVCKEEQLRNTIKGHDVIVNLAAAHRDDVEPASLYITTNVDGARCLCRAASREGIKTIIFTSSVAVYGFPKWEYAEDAPTEPFNEYGRTKLLAERVYEEWRESAPGNQLRVIRPTVIFGEGNRGNVYNLFYQIAHRRFLMIGSGENRKSMAYVGNVCAFIQWNIEQNQAVYSVYNYVDKPDFDMNGLIASFETIMQKKLHPGIALPSWCGLCGGYFFDFMAFALRRKLPVSSIRIKKFCAQTVFSSMAMQKSGFKPLFNMQQALTNTIHFEFSGASSQEALGNGIVRAQ